MDFIRETETKPQPRPETEEGECPVCKSELHETNDMTIQNLKCRICKSEFHFPCIKRWMNASRESGSPRMNCPCCRCQFPVILTGTTQIQVMGMIRNEYRDLYLKELENRKDQFAREIEQRPAEPDWIEDIVPFHNEISTAAKTGLKARLVSSTENTKFTQLCSWVDNISVGSSKALEVIEDLYEPLRTERIRIIFDRIKLPINRILFEQATSQAAIILSFYQGEMTIEDVNCVTEDLISVLKGEYCDRLEHLTRVALLREFYKTDEICYTETDLEIISDMVKTQYESLPLFDHFKQEMRRLIGAQQQPGPAPDPNPQEGSEETPALRRSKRKRNEGRSVNGL